MAKKIVVDLEGRAEARRQLMQRALGDNPKPGTSLRATKSITQQLVERKLLEPSYAKASVLEANVRGISVSTVLSEKGLVPREKIIEAIENTDLALLSAGLEYDVILPQNILRENMIAVHAQTDQRLFISTAQNFSFVVQLLQPFVEGREIIEVEFEVAKWEEFEQNIHKIREPEEVSALSSDYNDPKSIISELVDDAEVLDRLIDKAAEMKASDIHVDPGEHGYGVLFRILGERTQVHSGSNDQYARLVALVKDRARVDPMETRLPQDGSFSLKVRGRPFNIRVSTVPTNSREKITMRLLDPEKAQTPLAQLGITEVDLWRRIVEHRNGLVLIVGATGSGKTTTLNATIREMKRIEKNIFTVDDPVEYQIDSVNHVQINEAVNLDYARAIRAFMRSDPDVIILGEIRDPVSASKAIQAAETGHLVIATIHAESVPMAIQRLRGLDVRIEDFEMLLRGVLVQFLVRTICPACSGAGCPKCFEQGYAGRTVISEIARVQRPSDVNRLINSDRDLNDKYWRPLWKDIESKLAAGVTDGAEIFRIFSSDLELMAEHSPIIKKVYHEERAKRHHVAERLASAHLEGSDEEEKMRQRTLAMSSLHGPALSMNGNGSALETYVEG